MKKLTQKLVLSVITMALVVVALGTSTFAWFTLTNSATLQSFEGQVTAGEGIEVSLGTWTGTAYELDGDSLWFTVLPSSVIQTYITNTQANFEFKDVTSSNGRTFNKISFPNGASSTATEGILNIKLYFRSALEQDIVWSSATLGGEDKDWAVNVASFKPFSSGSDYGTDESGNENLFVAAWTAARISVTGAVGKVNAAQTTPTLSTLVYQAPAGTRPASDTISVVTNTNDALETIVATDDALLAYDFTIEGSNYVIGDNAYGAASYALASGKELILSSLPALPAPTTVLSGTTSVATLVKDAPEDQYAQGDVTIRVWIEGWDAEAYDAIFETILTATLGFTTQTATA